MSTRFRAVVTAAPVMTRFAGSADHAWAPEQVQRGPGYRSLRLYNWLLGVSCGLTLLFGKVLGSQLAVLRNPNVSRGVLSLLGRYIHELLVVNLVLLGALLVRGPWARDVLDLLRDLARRQSAVGAIAVEPSYAQGALLVLRVAVVAPSIMLAALLLVEFRVERFAALAAIAACIVTTIAGLSAITGIAAVHLRRSVHRHAVWLWFAIWVIPEAIGAIVPGLPTPRSLIGAVLTFVSVDWGIH